MDCKYCGTGFIRQYGKQACCSDRCRKKYSRIGKKERICKGCRQRFVPKFNRWNTYCSKSCELKRRHGSNEAIVQRLPIFAEAISDGVVRWLRIFSETNGPLHIRLGCMMCGKPCQLVNRQRSNYCEEHRETRRRESRRKWRKRRKAIERGAVAEAVVPNEIFERDDWTCWICGNRCDISKQCPSHQAPTLDHVIPLAKGGSHTKSNLRCAHFICNVKKSDKVLNQRTLQPVG